MDKTILNLNSRFTLYEAPMAANSPGCILTAGEGIPAVLPCCAHTALLRAGKIKDPSLADYCKAAEITEHKSWWYTAEFDSSELPQADRLELRLTYVDTHAAYWLNGIAIGTSDSVHYPFVRDIKRYIVPGKNTLTVRVTSGLECVSDEMLAELNFVCTKEGPIPPFPQRGDFRRAFVRRPQYTIGWDWAPRCVTVGLCGDAEITAISKAVIRSLTVSTVSADEKVAVLHISVRSEQLNQVSTAEGALRFRLLSPEGKLIAEHKVEDLLLTSGRNYTEFDIRVEQPELWFPNGYGAQPLYTAEAILECDGFTDTALRRVGIRTLKLDTSKRDGRRDFTFIVNGIRLFCKGGDWIPPDSLYCRVGSEKLRELVRLAAAANFNMLRIWGGGIYERDAFYDACDEYGILLWHDYMYGCSSYPDHLESFRSLVRAELDYQTERLATHPCMALWCGNNEDHQMLGCNDFGLWFDGDHGFGLYTSNDLCVRSVREFAPHIPYWNSSPYGGIDPNASECGDVHHWAACFMHPDMEHRINPLAYDELPASFVTEYGYIGPSVKESIEQLFDGQPVDMKSDIWRVHTNTFEKATVAAGIEKHYGKVDLSNMDSYLYYAGMVHSMMLNYSLEALRFKDVCGGALFWMYDDTWCEVGWTIVDYFLRRKPGWYGVARAFTPVRLILRRIENDVVLMGCNDTSEELQIPCSVGVVSLDGKHRSTEELSFTLPARSRCELMRAPMPEYDTLSGLYCVMPLNSEVLPCFLRLEDTSRLRLTAPVASAVLNGDVLTISAETYINGIMITGAEVSDNYFDLLPGEVRSIKLASDTDSLKITVKYPTEYELPIR